MDTETITDEDLAATVAWFEKNQPALVYLERTLAGDTVEKALGGHTDSSAIADGETNVDRLERALVEMEQEERAKLPADSAETKAHTVRRLMSNPKYQALYARLERAKNSKPVSKAQQDRQTQAAKAIERAAKELQQQNPRLSSEKARTLVRRASPRLAAWEMGQEAE